eukprot:2996292-Alexandrium_andersonii.AAC.1
MGATSVTLLQLGWDPQLPGNWQDPRGDLWFVNAECDTAELRQALLMDVGRHTWSRASQFQSAAGSQFGVDFAALARPLK